MSDFNHEDVRRTFRLLSRSDKPLVELRILTEKGTYSGYFSDPEKLVEAAKAWNGQGNLYITLNELHPDCVSRRLHRVAWSKSGELTKDAEVVRRRNIYIDCDPCRLAGIPSTDGEHQAALETAQAIHDFLLSLEIPETVLISSGNGHGLFLAIDLPVGDGGLVERFLQALAKRFTSSQVKVDTSVHNASRIARLAGTLNCKGEHSEERPHRVAAIIAAPKMLEEATSEQLQSVISAIEGVPAKEQDALVFAHVSHDFDVAAWLTELKVEFIPKEKQNGDMQFSLAKCPFRKKDDTVGGANILQKRDGTIFASCFHESCKWGWNDLRLKLDPAFDDRVERFVLGGFQTVGDPHRLANLVLSDYSHPDHATILVARGCYFTWEDGIWVERRVDEVNCIVTRRIRKEFERYTREMTNRGVPVAMPHVTKKLVGDVLNALRSLIEVTDVSRGWLAGDGRPLDEILLCKSSIVHLPGCLKNDGSSSMPHTPRLFVTNKLEFDFDANAPTPTRWLHLMDELWPADPDSVRLLQEFFGYCLIPDTSQQKLLMLIGASRGGKSTLTNHLTNLVGESNVCAIRLKMLGSRFGLENAVGKSLIISPDATMPNSSRAIEIAEILKAIVGGDPVDVDRKGRPVISTRLPAKVVIVSNNMLALPDESAALYNRMLALNFTQSFLGKEDTGLSEKLRRELPGTLLWAIRGYDRLRAQGAFTEPKSGRLLKRRLKASGSPVASFVDECCRVGTDQQIDKRILFNTYLEYCKDLEIGSCDFPQFCAELRAAVPAVDDFRPSKADGKRPRMFTGIALNGVPAPASEHGQSTGIRSLATNCDFSVELPACVNDSSLASVPP